MPASVPRSEGELLLSRARSAYLGLAIGDALGATVEFMTPSEIAAANRRNGGRHREILGGGWLRLRPGQVTDDTTMALALGESILAASGRVEAPACAQAFDRWMRAKPVDIGNTVRRGILHYRRTGESQVLPSQDAGNGAAMRCLPVALALAGAPDEALAEAALAQARVTHHNELSDAAVVCLVQMLSDLVCGAGRSAVLARAQRLVEQAPAFAFRTRRCDNPSGYVVDTLRAVLQALEGADSLEHCLLDVVNRGGDADTTGAIAGMLGGAMWGIDGVPRRWLQTLDGDVRARCEAQAGELLRLAPAFRNCGLHH